MKIINIKNNNSVNNINKKLPLENYVNRYKYFLPSNNVWYNSSYLYNIANDKSLPILDKITYKLLKTYFNMYNSPMERKVKLKTLKSRKRLFSTRKVFINKLELKHNNDKVVINVHLLDRNYNIISKSLEYYFKKLSSIFAAKYKHIRNLSRSKSLTSNNKTNNSLAYFKELSVVTTKSNIVLNKLHSPYMILLDYIKKHNTNLNYNIISAKWSEQLKNGNKDIVYDYLNKFKEQILLLTRSSIKDRYTMKMIYNIRFIKKIIMKYKLEFIVSLQKIIGKLYGKKVIFNVIFLKNYYLSSEILTQVLALVSKNRNNRIFRTMKKTLAGIKVPLLRKSIIDKAKKNKSIQSVLMSKNLQDNTLRDTVKNYYNRGHDSNSILNSLNNKSIIGVRIESAGRLTRRFTAQRAIKKVKYIGTIRNVDSSLKGLSTQVVKSKMASSLQHSKNNAQNRIGSFGIKGWINSI